MISELNKARATKYLSTNFGFKVANNFKSTFKEAQEVDAKGNIYPAGLEKMSNLLLNIVHREI
jgi:hypothetical protein